MTAAWLGEKNSPMPTANREDQHREPDVRLKLIGSSSRSRKAAPETIRPVVAKQGRAPKAVGQRNRPVARR